MSDLLFQVKKEEEKADYGRFSISPLASGFGHTLGTGLRRVLLTSLSGAAVTSVKIAGARHRFTTISGLKEDIIELTLNIKNLRIAYTGKKPTVLKLEANGPGEVKAEQIKTSGEIEIVNPGLVLANLADRKAKLKLEMTVENGVGYSSFEDRQEENQEIGVIPIDALFSPILRVNYEVVATRVGRMTNLDKLVLEIWTDRTIKPSEAMKKAALILVEYFQQMVDPKQPKAAKTEKKENVPEQVARLSVEELAIPVRVANTLIKGGYQTVGDVLRAGKQKISKVKNVGGKSLKTVEAALIEKGVELN